ncbi:MAG: ABC transporter substrate-binding protein [Chloroflexi bacterium]|nr:ABC transporter substrate-binding protein [Chloroflexota bacterium]
MSRFVDGRFRRRVSRGIGLVAAALLIALAVSGCGISFGRPATPMRTFHFMAGYKPQANLPFVGVYLAQEKGYFAEQGLNVEIAHSAGQGEHLKLLLQGSVDVTTADADSVLSRRSEGLPVVSIAVLGQRGQRAFAVQDGSEIRQLKDFEGKLVGYKVYQTPDYLAMLAMAGVDRSRIQEVPVGFDPRLLAAGKVDVYPVFESNEPEILNRLGVPTRLFRPSDYGVPNLGLTYISRQQLVDSDPAALERFLKATLRGIEDARRDPEAATDIIMKFAPNEERAQQLYMLKVELDMANGPAAQQGGVGWSTTEQWQAFHDSLLTYGGLKQAVPVESVFTNTLLQAVYRDGKLVWP